MSDFHPTNFTTKDMYRAFRFGPRLKAIRECRGWDQWFLASEMGVGQSTISRWERAGSINCMIGWRLAGLLNVDRDWLLFGEGEIPLSKMSDWKSEKRGCL
ncbi:MAG: helix-turn-helix transcriptional regulator [Rhodobacteraceae bacterium]|nr:helix-turn-helix transcriptional regulator [Paracoccaceae bacterium]